MIDISISGLVKEFEVGKRILDGLSFQVDQGERGRSEEHTSELQSLSC